MLETLKETLKVLTWGNA